METYRLAWNQRVLAFGRRTCLMGILNVTPDSFSDGGQFLPTEAAVAHGVRLVRDGADILDIGGESTRPYSASVSAAEEIRRVIPVIEQLAGQVAVPISIDTTKASVAREALEAGASIVNDISALRMDPAMGRLVAEYGVPLVLMHMLGNPRTMQQTPTYTDPVIEIRTFLADAVTRAERHGIPREMTIIDPGIGFGKTVSHNLLLIKHLREFESLRRPILVGPSRKAFIRKILDPAPGAIRAQNLPAVENGTQAVIAAAVLNGAHIVRVHDVARARTTLALVDAIRNG